MTGVKAAKEHGKNFIIHQSMLYELLSNLIGLPYYTMTSYCTDLPFMARSSCSYCMDLPFIVDSIDSSTVCGQLQFFRSMQLSSLYQQHMMDSLNFRLKSLHKQWPKQCWSFYHCLTWAHLFTLSSRFIDFRRISKKCISWRMLTKFQQGKQSRVGQSFAIE